MSHRALIFAAFAPLALSCSQNAQSDPEWVVRGEPTCSECRIERRLVATINDAGFPDGALGEWAQVQANSNGSFLVLSALARVPSFDGVFLANADGSVTRRIGREGEGPGEYKNPQFSMETRSSYLIIDPSLQRLTRISKDSLTLEATTRFTTDPQGLWPIASPDGTVVVATSSGLVTIVSPEGHVDRTFRIGVDSLTGEERHPHYLSASGESTFWVSFREDHRVEKWNRMGELIDVVERQADWVRPRLPDSRGGDEYTQVWGVFEHPPGLLWIHAQKGVLVERTREGRYPDGTRTTIRTLGPDSDPGTRETRFEAIDLASRQVLASLVVPGWIARALPGSLHFMVIRTPETVVPMIEVWTLDLFR